MYLKGDLRVSEPFCPTFFSPRSLVAQQRLKFLRPEANDTGEGPTIWTGEASPALHMVANPAPSVVTALEFNPGVGLIARRHSKNMCLNFLASHNGFDSPIEKAAEMGLGEVISENVLMVETG